jgi:type II restriction/modification system DNA methylase subunit YeeA
MLKLEVKKPRKFISPLLSKHSIEKPHFERFKDELSKLKRVNQSETEEHQKNVVKDFLVNSFAYVVNTKDRIDLAIFEDHHVEVIIEAKRLGNTSEMITQAGVQKKAFAEAVKYFMDERSAGNFAIKHIIILTAFEWFVFDAKEFEKLFWQDRQFKKIYTDYTNSSSLLSKTGDVYEEFIKLFGSVNSKVNLFEDANITCAYFNLKETHSEKQLIAIYKLLSPDTLQKKFNPNDANTLNKAFYSELLYILGLEEVKSGGKKLIQRAKSEHSGALYENITQKLVQYGKPTDFESVIRLMIIWINRILFLKLLESQLIKWNGSKEFAFLNAQKIKDFDQLEMLFFDILAKRPYDRGHREFDYVPYLNSSLFEPHAFEQQFLTIATLQDDCMMPYYSKTVLKDDNTKRKEGEVNMLHYLFAFLDAYDFSSEGSEELVSESKSLINASVLGLIFEKLNGYKDGSFYTPSFITMYMSKETITKAIVEKFNQTKGWTCSNILDVYNEIEDKKEANDIIDSLTICDPAVGSGHFLVSSLNTILEIKSYLKLLHDENGMRIKYELSVENDELIVRDDEGEIFEYKRKSKEAARIQKMLFTQKQNIIENSLFGVDINPNSAQITRLRLWIELLKNSYYDASNTLVTMPNIDINIKVGNSLISRYGLEDEIDIPNIKHAIERYKASVKDYKEGNFLSSKDDIRTAIEDVKGMFGLTLKAQWKQTETYKRELGKYVKEYGMDGLKRDMQLDALEFNYGYHGNLFEEELSTTKKKEKAKLLDKVIKAKEAIEEIEKGKIYENAFEWRFEFPEVLDDEGNFVGFDVVIGNPPYIDSESMSKSLERERIFITNTYEYTKGNWDIYIAFFDRGLHITNKNGVLTYITPDKWLAKPFGDILRKNIFKNIDTITKTGRNVFEEAKVDSVILQISKGTQSAKYKVNEAENGHVSFIRQLDVSSLKKPYNMDWVFTKNLNLLLKVERNSGKLIDYAECENACSTADTYKLKPFIKDSVVYHNDFKMINTGTIDKYISKWGLKEMVYLKTKYLHPIVNKESFIQNFGKTYVDRALSPKLIIKGLTKLDASIDFEGNILPGKSTLVIKINAKDNLMFMASIVNSKLAIFYIKEKYAGASYNQGINFTKGMINNLPMPNIKANEQYMIIGIVDKIITLKKQNQDTTALEAQIDEMVYALYGLSDEEIAIVEGRDEQNGENEIGYNTSMENTQ